MNEHQKTIAAWDKLSKAYEEKFMHLDIYNHTYDAFCNTLPSEQASVLELGCGPGNITRYLLHKRPDVTIMATDAAPTMVALAQRNNPKADCRVLDVLELDSFPGNYNGVLCGFILPYFDLIKAEKLIRDAKEKLKSGGVLYLSFIEGDYATSGPVTNSLGDTMMMYKHETATMESLLHKHKYTLLHRFSIPYPVGDKTDVHTVMIASKN